MTRMKSPTLMIGELSKEQMMSNIFFIADPHFGHEGVCRFLREDGSKLRPWEKAADMDEAMVENWNRVVGINDKVYCLGDIVMKKEFLPVMARLKGKKNLVRGNHDIFTAREYLKYFYDIHKLCRHVSNMSNSINTINNNANLALLFIAGALVIISFITGYWELLFAAGLVGYFGWRG